MMRTTSFHCSHVFPITPRPDSGRPVLAAHADAVASASTMTRGAFISVCVVTGLVMLLVAGGIQFMADAGQPAPPVPGVPFVAGMLLLAAAGVAAWLPRQPAWFGPVVALALIGVSMAALWFNGLLPLLFFAPLVMLLHLLLSPAQALWATLCTLSWPVLMAPVWFQEGQMPFALRAWAAAVLVGVISQFVVRQNRRFAAASRDLLAGMAAANRDLLEADHKAQVARDQAERLAADLSKRLDELELERDRARKALEQAELDRQRAQDSLVQNVLLEHEQDRLSRLLHASTEAMPLGLIVLDAWGRIELANRKVWDLLGVDASIVDPAQGLAGLVRHQMACGFFDRVAASVLTQAVREYERWVSEVAREGPQATVPTSGPYAGVALHDLRLFRGWPMTLTPQGKLEAPAESEGASEGASSSAPGAAQGSTIAYHSRAISGLILHVRSSALPGGGIIRLYTDVSDLVGTAEALGRSVADLRAKDALLQAEVLRSRNEVELNNRFVASVSHEIRTAVQGVTGIAALLPKADAEAPGNALLRDLVASAQDLHRLSEDLLNLTRLRRAGFSFSNDVFDPLSMVERCVQMAYARLDATAVCLQWHVHQPMPLLVGDEQRVFQVVSNLLQNATKFTRRGQIRIDAWLVDDDNDIDDGDSLPDGNAKFMHVRVADTGRGIPYGLVGRVFEPFDQGDPSTNRDHGGTGLGLALSFELCEAMGGGIGVLSRAGVGSVFEMRVRLSVAPDVLTRVHRGQGTDASGRRAPAQSPALPKLGPVASDLAGVRVLVVDDNRLNRKLMSMWIEARGGLVTTAADGAEGVRLALEADFDCILMDMSMPVLNGLDAASAIRAAAAGAHGRLPTAAGEAFGRAHVPIIGVTAMARREDRQLCMAAGMDAHVAKPVRSLKLARTLRRVTDAQAWLALACCPTQTSSPPLT